MLDFRKSLPAFREKEKLLQAIARNQVCPWNSYSYYLDFHSRMSNIFVYLLLRNVFFMFYLNKHSAILFLDTHGWQITQCLIFFFIVKAIVKACTFVLISINASPSRFFQFTRVLVCALKEKHQGTFVPKNL